MTRFYPFHCQYFYLDQQTTWSAPVLEKEGYYVVIWWKTFPLGEFFIEHGEYLKPQHFEERLLHAITPALNHYCETSENPITTLAEAITLCETSLKEVQDIPEQVDVSLVICTKDRAESLKSCLASLDHLRCKPAEIIVVDNATKDDSTRKAATEFKGVRYVREDRPGLDIARNTGAKEASRPIIIYTDDDTIIHPLWVYNIWKTFEDPEVTAMTGLVLAHELKTEAQWIFEKYWPFNRGYIDKRYDQAFFSKTLPTGPPVWEIGAGANMAFRKSAFEKTGYFDERLDVGAAGCNGDSEMWYRILAGGGIIHYNPRAVVSHFHRESLEKLQSQIFSYMRGFTAAVLIQHQRHNHRGNLRHLFLELPKYYCYLLARGFPRYRGRFTTVFSELKGLFSGLIFYLKNRNSPPNIT
jgi:glycosyltransferase involved in cell wall biosynthesis